MSDDVIARIPIQAVRIVLAGPVKTQGAALIFAHDPTRNVDGLGMKPVIYTARLSAE